MPRPQLSFLLCLASFLAVASLIHSTMLHSFGQEAQASTQTPVAREPAIVLVPIEARGVDASQLFEAVSSELHWVTGSITAFSRIFGLKTEGVTYLRPEQIDELVERFPDVFMLQSEDGTEGRVAVRSSGGTVIAAQRYLSVDTRELAERLSDRKSELRKWLAGTQNQSLATMRKVTETWEPDSASPPRILVTMAGLHAIESTAESVAKQLHRRTNLPAYVFAYPNDAPIAESSALLVQKLEVIHAQYPTAKITLVAHSMGGLVSRGALEMRSPSFARSSVAARTGVDQLIQICPPNHGSALSDYGPLLEGAEQLYRLMHRSDDRRSGILLGMIVDGFNEASADLSPTSDFLDELNQSSRNREVRYSILAGSQGPVNEGTLSLVSAVWDRIAAAVDEPKEINQRLRAILNCDELKSGKGDGVVALQSARLEGVTDFQILPMHHLVWSELNSEGGKQMLEAIASRLGVAL